MIKYFISAVGCLVLALSLRAQEKVVVQAKPGPSPTIRLRSTASATAVAPLVLVNAYETDMQSLVLNPANIESITVLKNISDTSLYGSKGANGVILIKTKPGTEFYTIHDFVNAEKNASVQKVKLNETVLPDMKKLLVEKTALKQTTVSSGFGLNETCKAVSQDLLVVMTGSGN